MLLIFLIGILYFAYEKHCETKQIESICSMDWLSFEQIQELIGKVKQ